MSIDLRQSDIQDGRYLAVGICHNCKEWQSGSVDFDSTTQPMIYAVGPDDLHLNSDAQDAGLRRHTYWGSFTIDLRAARGDPAAFPPNELNTSNATAKGDEHNDHEYTSSLHAVAMAGTGFNLASASHHNTAYAIIIGIVIAILFGLAFFLTRRRRRQEAFNSTPAQNFRNAYNGPENGIPLQPSYGPPPAYGRPMV
ncbi:MAG: hypothetical protein L6R38_007217 [Xanthoria sp. 2 TBL-2021]|nr:MAG: hypothetical protein L6R38_007217 [Xanthoria sp. 2 TBL-2021]